MLLPWIERYAIGDDLVDAQHRRLLEMINTLHSALAAKGSSDVVREVITQLVEYSREHFVAEEALMARIGYPGLPYHKKLHVAMIKKLTLLLQRTRWHRRPSGLALPCRVGCTNRETNRPRKNLEKRPS